MEMHVNSMCTACRHLDRDAGRKHACNAFPEGIPDEIWTNRYDHHDPYPGDNSIRFALAPIPLEQAVPQERIG